MEIDASARGIQRAGISGSSERPRLLPTRAASRDGGGQFGFGVLIGSGKFAVAECRGPFRRS